MNNSDTPWSLQLSPRSQKEVGNMNFVLDGKETVLGEKGGEDQIILAPHTKYEVEFTHTMGAFYHAFELKALDPKVRSRSIPLTADYPLLVATLKTRPKVELTGEEGAADAPEVKGKLKWNDPIKGDLTILPDGANLRPENRTYEIVNRTADEWRFTLASDQEAKSKTRGSLMVMNPSGKKDYAYLYSNTFVPANGRLKFWINPGPNNTFVQTIKLVGKDRQETILELDYTPDKPYPQDLTVTPLKTDASKPWVFTTRFPADFYLELQNPDADLDFGTP